MNSAFNTKSFAHTYLGYQH